MRKYIPLLLLLFSYCKTADNPEVYEKITVDKIDNIYITFPKSKIKSSKIKDWTVVLKSDKNTKYILNKAGLSQDAIDVVDINSTIIKRKQIGSFDCKSVKIDSLKYCCFCVSDRDFLPGYKLTISLLGENIDTEKEFKVYNNMVDSLFNLY